jgi:hypothetical protein
VFEKEVEVDSTLINPFPFPAAVGASIYTFIIISYLLLLIITVDVAYTTVLSHLDV